MTEKREIFKDLFKISKFRDGRKVTDGKKFRAIFTDFQ